MTTRRIERINSLLREVISEVIQREVKNPNLKSIWTITGVETTKDLRHAKVFVSVIGTPEEKKKAVEALTSARGFIAVAASKKVVLRFFPELHFKLDEGASHQARIEEILTKIRVENQEKHPHGSESPEDKLVEGELLEDDEDSENEDSESDPDQ